MKEREAPRQPSATEAVAGATQRVDARRQNLSPDGSSATSLEGSAEHAIAGREVDPPRVTALPELLARVRALAAREQRILLGITGAPGAGKSRLAERLVEATGDGARLVSMDGFHLAQSRLAELGRLQRKGAIDTFDAAGFLALIRRLRSPGPDVVYAPEFRRDLEESIACAVPIEPAVPLVIVEGNYLLARERPWFELRELFDEVWYCERDEGDRIADLIARHRHYGKSDEEARRWALGPDQRNAELIGATRSLANIVVTLDQAHGEAAQSTQAAEKQ